MPERLPYLASRHGETLDLLADLPRDALRPVARFFAELARVAGSHATAHEIAMRRRRKVAGELKSLSNLGAVVAILMSEGHSFDDVSRLLEREGVPPETTLHYWKEHRRIQERIARAQRDREIMRLAARGWTNKQIALRFGLHEKSISRIVQRVLRTNHPIEEEIKWGGSSAAE